MTDKAAAADAKAKGNTAFAEKNYEEAIKHFTEAIKCDPSDHVFFSNRSACYASLEQYDKAFEDGAQCVTLKPDWAKGYTRKGLAEYFLGRYDEASETYKAGLKLAPEDATLRSGLKQAMDAKYEVAGAGSGGGLFGKMDSAGLAAAALKNPKIAEYMKDKALLAKVNSIMSLGASAPQVQQQLVMQMMQQDPRVLEIIAAAQGLEVRTEGEEEDESAPSRKPEAKKEPPPPEDKRTPTQKEADEYKNQGNDLYKKRKFEEAIEMYSKAIETEPNDLTYYNNKCAVWIELGEKHFPEVLQTCQDLLSRRYEINTENPGGASFEKVAKVYSRMASVYEKQLQFDQAIEMYNKSLMEDNSRATRNSLRELERAKEKWEKDRYLDPAKAEEHRQLGNDLFKQNDYVGAKREYDEALKRNPSDAKLFSNRAAALTKLLAYPDALRDLDECLRLDPSFVKAYSRKGAAHFFMKEYNRALEAYEKGLMMEKNNEECARGRDQVLAKIMETQRSDEVDEEQVRHAMADPEIQQILKDPQINMFLKDMQEDPVHAQKAMASDSKLREAVSKLMAAGILRTR